MDGRGKLIPTEPAQLAHGGSGGDGGSAIGIKTIAKLTNNGNLTVKAGKTGNVGQAVTLTTYYFQDSKGGKDGFTKPDEIEAGDGGNATGISATAELINNGNINVISGAGGDGVTIVEIDIPGQIDSGAGGKGGNAIGIISTVELTNNGNINSNAGDGGNGGTGSNGRKDVNTLAGTGGAGGNGGNATGINLTASNQILNNRGNITVKGGNGGKGGDGNETGIAFSGVTGYYGSGGNGGDGGNGIGFDLASQTALNNSGSVTVIGGNAGSGGTAGTGKTPGKDGVDGFGYVIVGNEAAINNTGVMLASTNVIKGDNNNFINAGIIGTVTGSTATGNDNDITNGGLEVKVEIAPDGNVTVKEVISSGTDGTEITVKDENGNDTTYTAVGMTGISGDKNNSIINSTKDNYETDSITINTNTAYNTVIINGTTEDKTLTIDEGAILTYINGQVNTVSTGTLVNGTLDANNVTFNSMEETSIVIGENGVGNFTNNSTIVGGVDLTAGKATFVLKDSIITGEILTGDSNIITLDNSFYGKSLDLTQGNNQLTIANNANLEEFTLGTGDNIVTIDNAAYKKQIDMSKGSNTLNLSNGAGLIGVTFGDDLNNTLTMTNTKNTLDVDFLSGDNTLSMNNGVLIGDVSMGNATNESTVSLNDSFLQGSLTLGDNSMNLGLTDSKISGAVNMGVGDHTIAADNSMFGDAVSLGHGNNTVTLTHTYLDSDVSMGDATTGSIITLKDSFLNGALTMGSGENILDITSSKISEIVTMGEGDQTITANNSILGSGLTLGNGDNNIDLADSYITGTLTVGDGNNTILTTFTNGDSKHLVANTIDYQLGNGNNTITFGNNIYLEGSINAGSGTNNLSIGSDSDTLNYLDLQTSKMNEIKLAGKTELTAGSNLKANEINFDESLYLGLNLDIKNSKGNVIGNGIYDSEATVTGDTLILDTSRVNKEETVDFGNTVLNVNKIQNDSILHEVEFNQNGEVVITADSNLPGSNNGLPSGDKNSYVKYNNLNKVYQSIYNADKVGLLSALTNTNNKTKEQAFEATYSYLDQMYANSPYAFARELSLNTFKVYNNAMLKQVNAKDHELNITGVILGDYRQTRNKEAQSSFYWFDNGYKKYKIDSIFAGLLFNGSYGVSDNLSLNLALGTGNQYNSFTNDSKLNGTSFYVGANTKYIGDSQIGKNSTYSFGVGFDIQKTFYNKVDRTIKTGFTTDSYGKNFQNLNLNTFLNTEFNYNFESINGLTLTPKYQLNFIHSYQDKINEGANENAITIQTERAHNHLLKNEFSLKLNKEIYADAFWNYSVSIKGGYTLNTGDLDNKIGAKVVGSTSGFDLMASKLGRNEYLGEIGFTATKISGFEVELLSAYSADSNKNRAWTAGLNLTYKL